MRSGSTCTARFRDRPTGSSRRPGTARTSALLKRRSTRSVSSSELSAEDLYENAPCGYLSTTPDGRIVRVNATFLRWTGYANADLVGVKRFQDLLTAGGRIYHQTHY